MKAAVYLLIASLFIFSCSEDSINVANIRVNHYKQTAIGVGFRLIFTVQEGNEIGSDEWRYFTSEISNFDYEWGYIYDLNIEKREIENPSPNGEAFEYVLQKVISKTPVSSDVAFDIPLKSPNGGINFSVITGNSNLGFELLNDPKVTCNDLCDEMVQLLDGNTEVIGTFVHSEPGKIQLIDLK